MTGSNRLVVSPYHQGAEHQQWVYNKSKNTIEGRGNKVLDIADSKKNTGAEVCAWDHSGADNQKWSIEHR